MDKEDNEKAVEFYKQLETQQLKEQDTIRKDWDKDIANTLKGYKEDYSEKFKAVYPEIEEKLKIYYNYDFNFYGTGEQLRVLPILDKFVSKRALELETGATFEERMKNFQKNTKKVLDDLGTEKLWEE